MTHYNFCTPARSQYGMVAALKKCQHRRDISRNRNLKVGDCLNARRIWSSTPQIADDADDADYRMGGGGRRLGWEVGKVVIV